jgi:putative membrane protein
VLPSVVAFGAIATLVYLAYLRWSDIAIQVGPHEVAGALLGILLVMRTNAGYERWWEGRKAWGGIVNQSRNLVLAALAYGPADPAWRAQVVRWTAAFAHAVRARLRGLRTVPELVPLLGKDEAAAAEAAGHMPNFVALRLARLLRDACDRRGMDGFAFLQAERERALLIDHLGACERILNTPLPRVYSIAVRRFIFFFLASVPFALLHKEVDWLDPFLTMLLAYLLLTLDQLGVELQNPFATSNLAHLPLEDICTNLERNLLDLLAVAGEPGA